MSLENTFKSNFRVVLLHVNRVIVFGKLPLPAERNPPCTTFFFFSAGTELDYSFNFMYDYDIENDKQNMCVIRSWDRVSFIALKI